MTSLWDRIWQRPIFRTAATYVVVAWIVVQVGSVLIPAFGFGDGALRLVVLLTILGLPAVLTGAWFLDRRGLSRDDRTAFGVMLDFGVILLVTGAAGIAANQVPATLRQAGDLAEAVELPLRGVEANSIAVLPFLAFSDQQEDEFFADGLTEEILNSLARIPGLKVVGRTSVFYYKGRAEDLRTIATQLNVRYVLEGSVRRDGENLRITAQLIEADSGFHLWSDTYDRVMQDVLGIQTTIAEKVAGTLKVTLLGDVVEPRHAVMNPEAKRYFLIGLARLRQRGPDNIAVAIDHFERAIALDANHPEILAHLASAYILRADYEANHAAAIEEARRLVDRALSVDPNCATAHAVRGLIYLNEATSAMAYNAEVQALAETAKASFDQAIRIDPNNVEARLWYGIALVRLDDDTLGGYEQFNKILDIDPLFLRGIQNAASSLTALGRFQDARQLIRELIDLYPRSGDAYLAAALFERMRGREDGALKWTVQAVREGAGQIALMNIADHYEALGALELARHFYEKVAGEPGKGVRARIALAMAEEEFSEARAILDANADDFPAHYVVVLRAVLAIRDNEPEAALALLRDSHPGLFETPLAPLRSQLNGPVAMMAAYALIETGAAAEAAALLAALEALWTPVPPKFDLICHKALRSATQAMAGKTEAALDTLEGAVEQGFARVQNPVCGLMPAPIAGHPYFKALEDSPRYEALMARIRNQAIEQLSRVPPALDLMADPAPRQDVSIEF